MMNTGSTPIIQIKNKGLLATVLWKLKEEGPVCYALEGAIESGGSTLNWLKDNVQMFKTFEEFNSEVEKAENSNNEQVYFVPALSGLFSPYWRDDVQGTLLGLSFHT